MALVNRIFGYGRGVITIRYPLYGTELFSFDSSFKVKSASSKHKFYEARKAATSWSKELSHEAPEWNQVMDSFVSSGTLKPQNLADFAVWARKTLEDRRRPELAARPFFLAIDTNVAYNRLFTRHFPIDGPSGVVRAPDFRFLLCDVVRREVDEQIKRKYRGELNQIFTHPEQESILKEIGGRNVLVARRAKLAQNEIDYLDKTLNALTVPCTEFPSDKEDRDILIAKTYGAFSRDRNVDIALLTMDQNMVDHAKNAQIMSFSLRVPGASELEKVELHYSLWHLLHDLAVALGVIDIEPFGTRVYGEWAGKTTSDYGAERVKIVLDDKAPIANEVVRDFRICAKVLGVSISG
jgi:hypothetical protein